MFLSLNGQTYTNRDSIVITEIGNFNESESGINEPLLCYTDNINCCNGSGTGNWIFPDGTSVGPESEEGDFYVDRGSGVVRLNRRRNAISPTGEYCCNVPNSRSQSIRTCVSIGKS